jgi:hypothetical protein
VTLVVKLILTGLVKFLGPSDGLGCRQLIIFQKDFYEIKLRKDLRVLERLHEA